MKRFSLNGSNLLVIEWRFCKFHLLVLSSLMKSKIFASMLSCLSNSLFLFTRYRSHFRNKVVLLFFDVLYTQSWRVRCSTVISETSPVTSLCNLDHTWHRMVRKTNVCGIKYLVEIHSSPLTANTANLTRKQFSRRWLKILQVSLIKVLSFFCLFFARQCGKHLRS